MWLLSQVYFGKTREVVANLRASDGVMAVDRRQSMQANIMGACALRKQQRLHAMCVCATPSSRPARGRRPRCCSSGWVWAAHWRSGARAHKHASTVQAGRGCTSAPPPAGVLYALHACPGSRGVEARCATTPLTSRFCLCRRDAEAAVSGRGRGRGADGYAGTDGRFRPQGCAGRPAVYKEACCSGGGEKINFVARTATEGCRTDT